MGKSSRHQIFCQVVLCWLLLRQDHLSFSWDLEVTVHVSIQLNTSTRCGPRQKPSSENRPWDGITAGASTRAARLSRLWNGRIYWIPERAFSPSPALSATCLETGLHYRWASGRHHTLTALRLPPVEAHRYSTCICTKMEAAFVWMYVTEHLCFESCHDACHLPLSFEIITDLYFRSKYQKMSN